MNKNLRQKLRVANIIEEGRLGGPQTRMVLVASSLKDKIDTTFIFPKKNSKDFQERCDAIGIKYSLFSFTSISRNWMNILKYLILFPFEIFMLSKFLKKNSFDIVHVSGGSRQFKGIIAAKIANIKVIWELNDTYAPALIRNIFFLLSNLATTFVFASKRTKEYYERLNARNQKSFLIQSPVDLEIYNPAIEFSLEDFIKNFVNEKKIIIGTVANVSPVKGLVFFLKVVKKLSSYSDKIVFIVVGSVHNSQKKYYKDLLKIINQAGIKNFFFLGARSDVRPLLKAMHIYVCSSNNESSPLALWEAMSMKKAIVSTDVGDVRRFITDGINGFIVNQGDENSLIDNLKKLIDDPELRLSLGNSARKVAKEKLDLNICTKLHLKMYQTIVETN